MQFKYRIYDKEYLDRDDISTKDLYRTLDELDVINERLGGYRASLNGLKQVLNKPKAVNNILDIGFGGGDFIKKMAQFAQKKQAPLFFYGVDLKQDCIDYAEKNLAEIKNKELICDDYRNIAPELLEKIDVLHCSLFLHHLTDEEIINLFQFGKTHQCIIVANDLHRNPIAYYSIIWLTALFSKSWLVKNDAGLSVRRAFKKSELEQFLSDAGYKDFEVQWSWAFRYRIIAYA